MQNLILAIWIFQGMLMFFDEFYFHHKRGLGKWERIGHPIDSFFFLVPFLYSQYFTNTSIFVALCLFSSLLVTKDEFIHKQECLASEQWLHALLFLIHPVALFALWTAWREGLDEIIKIQAIIILVFMIYQIVTWNYLKGNMNEAKN